MDRKTYRALPGVAWVNGAPVPASGTVDLTDTEARFDSDHGRVEPVASKQEPAARKNRSGEAATDGGADGDGGN
ncbi:MAG: hypothetical protein J0H18_17605 [Rhizobiales bacterium]|nr:hypothetical protein [Hyphomicrobiales bacterium]